MKENDYFRVKIFLENNFFWNESTNKHETSLSANDHSHLHKNKYIQKFGHSSS